MNSLSRLQALLTVVLALGMATLACGPSLGVGAPTPPGSPIPVSTQAAGQLENSWGTAVAKSANGQVVLVMTEEQLTSYAVLKLQTDPTAPITGTQVYLRKGQIMLYGDVKSNNVSVPAAIALSVVPTASGAVSVTIQSLNLGPLPVPSALTDSLAANLNDLIAQNAGTNSSGFKVSDIIIGDHVMTVTGVLSSTQQ